MSAKFSCGGVVIDEQNRVLLREPKNHYGGYVWTYAKGEPGNGETPEQAALREVLEETGVEAQIIEQLPGVFVGDTGVTVFFLMRLVKDLGKFDPQETSGVKWVDFKEARNWIEQTTTASGRKRDLNVLAAVKQLLDAQ